jgi:rod shape determining protein RodA
MIDGRSNKRGLRHSVDWWLIGVYLALVIIGWVNIYAATHTAGAGSILDWGSRAGKQFVWILTAFGLAGLILFVLPPQIWEGGAPVFYAFVLGLLVLVIFVSSDVKGSHSWFDLGPVRFQPAEISKITTSLLLALVMSQQWFKIRRPRDFLIAAVIIGLPMLVIIAESETGSALVYAGFIFVLYREGLSGWWLAIIGLVILLFVGTLTAGAYTALLILIGILVVCNIMADTSRFWPRLIIGGGFVLVMALLPSVQGWIGDLVQGEMDKLALRPWVPQADETQDYFWGFLLKIKPLWVLIGVAVAALPFLLWYAYKFKDRFLALTTGVFLAGMVMVFSTDFVFQNVLQPHQRSRIEVLLGLREDLAGVGYNVNQSKIAIGSGGLFGKGFLHGTQTTFGFVPEQSTDFIFCTVGEEWGFLGCLVVIGLYVWLIARLMADAERCRGKFTRIYGYCVAACVFMHLFINVGMTVGLMPVIGIPLPLLSYGGSSLWAFTILIFIFLALYRNEKKYF